MQNDVQNFKQSYKKFREALEYINSNIDKLKLDKQKWEVIQINFKNKYEKPLDEAWQKLSEEDKNRFHALYLHRRYSAKEEMERINKIVKMFNGKITSVKDLI